MNIKIVSRILAAIVLFAACSKDVPVSSVVMDRSSITMAIGETAKLNATAMPANATDKTLTWSSSNTAVATVREGLITAISVGSATVTATSADGKSATCQVTVSPLAVQSVSLNVSSLDMHVGDSKTLTATVLPDNATDKSIIWSSSDSSIATVDQNGQVKAFGLGTAIITATSGDGLKTGTCKVTVDNSMSGGNEKVNEGESQPWK